MAQEKSVWSLVPFHHTILFSNDCTGHNENKNIREIEIKTTISFSLLKFTRQPGGQSDMV